MMKKQLPYLFIFILAIAQYANTRNHDFAWDDAIVLTENSRTQKGWSNIPELFENIKTPKVENRYGYRPISLLSFATDVQFFGLDAKASHRVNILLYGLLCLIVFLFLQRLFPHHKWQNFLVAVLFVVHPLHTEVVANIKSRDEVLAMGFGLLSMLAFLKAFQTAFKWYYALSLFLLLLGFLSKENAVVFCGVALLLLWYKAPQGGGIKDWGKRLVPIVLAFGFLILVRVLAYSESFFQNTDQELYDKGIFLYDGFVGNPLFDVESDFLLKWLNIIYLGVFHVYKFIVPVPLVHDYAYNHLALVDFSDMRAYGALLLGLGLIALTFFLLHKRTVVGFGLAFFVIAASVFLHVGGLAPDIFAERFLFVSSLGLCIAVVYLTFSIVKNKLFQQVVFVSWLVVSGVLFSVAHQRNAAWKNNETLLQTDLRKLKNGARINYNYALYLHNVYYELPENQRVAMQDSILHYYERTVQITDRLLPAYLDLGAAYMEFQRPQKAKPIFLETIEKYPHIAASHVQMAKYEMSYARYAEAIPYLEKAIEIGARGSDYYYLLSICQFNTNQHQKAIETLQKGEEFGEVGGAYLALLVRLHLRLGNVSQAEKELTRALARFPSDAALLQMKAAVATQKAQ